MDSVLYTLRLWQREYSVLIARVTEKQAVGAPRIAHSYFRLMKWPLGKLAPDYSSGARRRPCCAAQVLGFEAMTHPVVPSRDLWLGGGWRQQLRATEHGKARQRAADDSTCCCR